MIKNERYPDDSSRRLRELLAGQVLGDLTPEEEQELWNQPSGDIDIDVDQELEELELTAAAVQSALSHFEPAESRFPEQLKQQLMQQAAEILSPTEMPPDLADATSKAITGGQEFTTQSQPQNTPPTGNRPTVRTRSAQSGISIRESLAWLAFAASLLLAFVLWRSDNDAENLLSAIPGRAQLLAQASDVIQVAWSEGKHPFNQTVNGDVVWSNQQQTGYMRFVGMPPNDPSVEQYQLWIIDPQRDDEPIDGGVFDIPSSGEVIVPIQAKLQVIQPAAFAITIEKPGGVVVSTQDQLPLLAQVP